MTKGSYDVSRLGIGIALSILAFPAILVFGSGSGYLTTELVGITPLVAVFLFSIFLVLCWRLVLAVERIARAQEAAYRPDSDGNRPE